MNRKNETGLIIVKEDVFTKLRKNLFSIFFKKENELLKMLYEIEKPRNVITGKIVIPQIQKEIRKL